VKLRPIIECIGLGGLLAAACVRVLAGPAAPAAPPAAAAPQAERFAILEYRVLGNTVLPARAIERAVYSHLGPERSITDAQAARLELEKAYRDAGYSTVYVDIPEQSVEEGIVRLRVTEGRLARVRVSGTRYFSNRRILAGAPALEPGVVPYFPAIQQQLAELNRQSSDLKLAPVLRPGAVPGTVDLDLRANDTLPLHASVEVNNRYTIDTTHTRLYFNLAYTNLFQTYQSLAMQYQMAPERTKDSGVFAASYSAPLGSPESTLTLLAVDSNSNVVTLGTLGVLGKGQVYGAHYGIALPSEGSFYPSFTIGGDYKNFDQNVLLTAGSGLETPIDYVNWSAVYGGAFAKKTTTASFDVDLNFGIRGLVNYPAEFENNRFLAKPNYTYLRANGTAEQVLGWGTRLALRFSGQYTTEPLISNEQFAIGGVESVRGYHEAEELGDLGVSGALELRTGNRSSLFGLAMQQAYLFVFGDAGVVGVIAPLPQQESRMHLGSWGLGFRLISVHGLEAALDWAYPLVSSPAIRAGDSRLDFRFRAGF
jgi:hemolysin activation/secretion protein